MDLQQVKRRRLIDIDHCVFCDEILKDGDYVKTPKPESIGVVFEACTLRKDSVSQKLLPYREDILSGNLAICYHKSCRSRYVSKSNLGHVHVQCDDSGSGEQSTSAISGIRALRKDPFDIRRDCFICSKVQKLVNRKREKLTPISTGTGESTRQKVLNAALARGDESISLRMTSCTDLFAFDAKYHRSCLSIYLSDRNISSAKKRSADIKQESHFDVCFRQVAQEIEDTVLSDTKSVTTLSKIKSDLTSNLQQVEQDMVVYSWKLKEKLKTHFQHKLAFIERPGLSDLVCSSTVSVSDALCKANDLHEDQQQETIDDLPDVEFPHTDEKLTLHAAAGILRKHLSMINENKHIYVPSSNIALDPCADFVPDSMYDFVNWLTDETAYSNASSCVDAQVPKSRLSTISICHSIIAKAQHIRTPMTLGLGLYIHHEFGSKQLVQEMHALGHCISYHEVLRFLTSAAIDQQDQEREVQFFIPRGLQPSPNESVLIDAAIDNFDQNEETLDGKSTTHAMAAVVYKRSVVAEVEPPIKRVSKKRTSITGREDAVTRYPKPPHRPQPNPVVDASFTNANTTSVEYAEASRRDLLWQVSRLQKSEEIQVTPSWTGFNSLISSCIQPLTTIRYLPFIRAPPTEFSTIYTALLQLVELAEFLGQDHILVTADMAIYAKAQELLWAKPPSLVDKVTMRVGGMHLTMSYLASLGTLYGDGGLLSMLVDSEVYAYETARKMLQGKQYSRGIRGIKLVHEALFRLFFGSMESWLESQGRSIESGDRERHVADIQEAIKERDTVVASSLATDIEQNHLSSLKTVIDEFRKVGRETSKTFAFWDTFIQGGDILLHMLRAERESNFELHLITTCQMIPWLTAAGRHTYAKFLPTYIADMRSMKVSHPASYQHMQDGGFVVRRDRHHQFNCVATDQALEQTVNRDGKSKGGVIGLTQRKAALSRWLMTRHITASYREAFKSLSDMNTNNSEHAELGRARITRDEHDVSKIMDAVQQYQNPFDLDTVPKELINISTGHVTSAAVSQSLCTFLNTGLKNHKDFINKRLVEDTKCKSFWDPVTRTKVLTFADMRKPLSITQNNKLALDSEVLFRRMLVVSKVREIDLESVLEHELAPVPPSMFHDDGMMRKSTKADLAKKLESACDEVYELTTVANTAYIVDGMALLQAMNEHLFTTFDDLADHLMKRIKVLFASNLGVKSVTIVFDRYDNKQSVKQVERLRRGTETGTTYVIKGTRTVPNYRKFLQNSENKASLAEFVSEYITAMGYSVLLDDQSIYLAGGFKDAATVKVVTRSTVSCLPELSSSHEEADTRMILHAVYLSRNHERLVVRCDDTDVLVVLLYYVCKGIIGSPTYMHAGHSTSKRDRTRYIPVSRIVETLGEDICQNLPAIHALTGCDTTNGLFKIGKRTAYTKLVEVSKKYPNILKNFGLSDDLDNDISAARVYILSLYATKKTQTSDLDKLRYLLASTTDKPAASLPPTEDAFRQHVLRSRYQVSIWCQSHVANPTLCNPNGNGWKVTEGGHLQPVFFTKDIAPILVRDMTHLYCTDSNCSVNRKCQCLQSGLKCTEFCTCHGDDDCPNTASSVLSDDSDED